jgi:hypothetical protein
LTDCSPGFLLCIYLIPSQFVLLRGLNGSLTSFSSFFSHLLSLAGHLSALKAEL